MCPAVRGKPKNKHRSNCPLSLSLEVLGDRWSLLIVRDLMVRGFRTFKEFHRSGEGIATNVLSERLRRLRAAGILKLERDSRDGRRVNYRLTEKGIDLAPALLEFLVWGARHENTGTACAVIDSMAKQREAVLGEIWRRWKQNNPMPLQVNGRWVWR